MAWITLAMRKQELTAEITNYDDRLLQISREIRKIARHKMYEESVFNNDKQAELRSARDKYTAVRDASGSKADPNSDEYKSWQQEYSNAREDYQYRKEQINDKYDSYLEDLEADASEMQTDLEQEQTETETILADLRAELESVKEQANTEIKNSAINFGN